MAGKELEVDFEVAIHRGTFDLPRDGKAKGQRQITAFPLLADFSRYFNHHGKRYTIPGMYIKTVLVEVEVFARYQFLQGVWKHFKAFSGHSTHAV